MVANLSVLIRGVANMVRKDYNRQILESTPIVAHIDNHFLFFTVVTTTQDYSTCVELRACATTLTQYKKGTPLLLPAVSITKRTESHHSLCSSLTVKPCFLFSFEPS
ncbi:hypothetical protein RIF29_27417 [Crotalaria pallida]|uniref:Uncharacterized protein n=1 Tax=Crotalaria pallida TaxID=3830 RepID=A0AAN9HYR0_CROPI